MGNKTTVGTTTLGGSVAALAIWVLGLRGVDVPPEAAAAMTVIFGALLGYLREV